MALPRIPGPPFLRFVLRRLAALVLLCLGITLIAFMFTQLVPGDPVAANLGEQAAADPAAVAAFEERYGLDDPLPLQYWHYLVNVLHGDLGTSLQDGAPVRENLATYVPATAELALLSTLIAVVVGVSSASWRRCAATVRPTTCCASSRSRASRCPRSGSRWSRSTSSSTGSAGSRAATGSTRACSRRRTGPGCTSSTRCSPASGRPRATRSTT